MQEALGELAGAAKEGLLALSVGVGLARPCDTGPRPGGHARRAPRTMATYAHFADRDPLTAVVMEQMLVGVSRRRFSRAREPLGQDVVDADHSTFEVRGLA